MNNYGKIVSPLISLLKKDAFGWNESTEHAFTALTDSMCMILVLSMSYFM
jgi:hypothetical protein